MRLQSKTALVTGASRGIGEAIAKALAAEGCSVALAGRKQALLEKVAAELQKLGQEALPLVCDVAHPQAVGKLFSKLRQHWDHLDILVNNAGQNHSDPFLKITLETWRRMLEVNLTGTFLCSQAALRWMVPRNWGRIINIASTASRIPIPYAAAYCAAKHGVLGLTRAMALETATSGVTVNAVCPGWVETDMFRDEVALISSKTKLTAEQVRQHLAKESPQKRIFQPEEVAFAAVFLACDEARGITGQAIDLCGGEVMS